MDVCVCVCVRVCGHWSIQSCTVQQNGEDCTFLTLEVCVCIYTYMHAYMHAYIHTYKCTRIYIISIGRAYRCSCWLPVIIYTCVCVCVCVQVIAKGKIPCDSIICNQANPDGMQLILVTPLGDIVVNGFGEVEFHDG